MLSNKKMLSKHRESLKIPTKTLLIVFAMVLLTSVQSIAGVTFVQSGKITIKEKSINLDDLIWKLEKQTGYDFVFNSELLAKYKNLNVQEEGTIDEVLKAILKDKALTYEVENNIYIIRKKEKPPVVKQKQQGQKKEIKGKVTDENGDPIPGVNIKLLDYKRGVVTNMNGNYKIDVPDKKVHLLFSFMGFEKQTIVVGGQTEINVQLKTAINELGGVIITGNFAKPKESFTGAVTFVSKKEIAEFRSSNLLSTISNIDPAFNIAENNEFGSDPNRLPEITLRGSSSVPLDVSDVQDNERANLNTPLFLLDGFEITLERMMDLDQEDIESVTILKDASSTALYGSRGANGVVVLSSVKPQEGKLRISVSGGVNLEIPDLTSYNLLNAREKLELESLAGLYKSDNADLGKRIEENIKLERAYSKKLKAVEEGVDTYWLSKPLQTGIGSNTRLSISGGNKAFRYSIAGSMNQVIGVMKGSYRNNFNGSANISYDMDKVKFVNIVSTGINASQNSQYGRFSDYVTLNPYWEMYDKHGEIVKKFDDVLNTEPVLNPMYIGQLAGYDKKGYNSIRNTTSIRWNPNENFDISLKAGISTSFTESNKFVSADHPIYEGTDENPIVQIEKGEYNFRTGRSTNWNIALTSSYAKVIDKHRIFAGIDYSMRENNNVSYSFDVQGFTHEKLDFLSMGSQYKGTSPGGSESQGRSIGFTGTVNYSYNNIAYLDLSYRLDGASTFGKHSRFKPFYSVGGGCTVSRMKFFADNIKFVSNLRLRYNYGVSGTLQFSSPYEAMEVYEYKSEYKYNGELASKLKGLANDELTWQMDYSHNLGMDLSLFDNRLSFSVNFYTKETKGLTTKVPLPLSNGFETYTSNRGDVLNEGYEASASYTILNDRARKLKWSVRASLSNNRNKLLKLSDEMKAASALAESEGREDPNYLYREGESMDALYVIPSLGIDPATGREIFVDVNGNPTYNWNQAKRRNYGVIKAKIDGRFSTSVSYKGFTATAGFRVRYGGQVYNSTLANRVEGAKLAGNVDKRVLDLRWRNPGDYTGFIGLDSKYQGRQTSRFVQDDNSLQFSSLNINYRVSSKWLKQKTYLKSLSFTASIGDLFYISSVKRERGTSYPHSIKPRFTASMTF